jgi:hypothetical protein
MRHFFISINAFRHCWSYIASEGLGVAPNSRTLSSRIIDLVSWQQPAFRRLFISIRRTHLGFTTIVYQLGSSLPLATDLSAARALTLL